MTIEQVQQQIISEFSTLSSWEDKYKKIIDYGKKLAPLDDELKVDEIKVRGCQSQVWLIAKKNDDGKIEYKADSDALIVKGLIALLLKVYSNQTPQEILKAEPDFVALIGLDSHLSPSRTNGLFAMVRQIKYYALAFQ